MHCAFLLFAFWVTQYNFMQYFMTKRTRALGFAVAVLSVAVLLLDSYAYHFSGWFTCLSDDLSVIEGGLREYEKSHAGQIPATFDEFRLFWNSTNRQFPLDT